MASLVIDSSVVVKWFVPEHGSEMADRVLGRYAKGRVSLLAPDLLFAEIGNIIWKKRRIKELDPEDADSVIESIRTVSFEITPCSELLDMAYR